MHYTGQDGLAVTGKFAISKKPKYVPSQNKVNHVLIRNLARTSTHARSNVDSTPNSEKSEFAKMAVNPLRLLPNHILQSARQECRLSPSK